MGRSWRCGRSLWPKGSESRRQNVNVKAKIANTRVEF